MDSSRDGKHPQDIDTPTPPWNPLDPGRNYSGGTAALFSYFLGAVAVLGLARSIFQNWMPPGRPFTV
jgi:hypothetical protein